MLNRPALPALQLPSPFTLRTRAQAESTARSRGLGGRPRRLREPDWPAGMLFADDPAEARRPHRPDPRYPQNPYRAAPAWRSTAADCAAEGDDDLI